MTTETNDWRSVVRSWQRRGFDLATEGRAVIMRRADKATIELLTIAEFGGAGFSRKEREALADELKQFLDTCSECGATSDRCRNSKIACCPDCTHISDRSN